MPFALELLAVVGLQAMFGGGEGRQHRYGQRIVSASLGGCRIAIDDLGFLQVRIATLNIHFWSDAGPYSISNFLRANGVDIIGLQEVPGKDICKLECLEFPTGLLSRRGHGKN
jgi:hypothetical protein